jgi:transcription antitermination protein NusB
MTSSTSLITDDQIDSQDIDPRHQRRMALVQQLFARFFNADQFSQADNQEYDPIVDQIVAQVDQLDALITTAAPERPLQDINKVDLAILRLIMFESEGSKTPKKVLINEAVELAKEFGTDSSPRFVNGVLGKLLLPGINQETVV